MTIFFKGLTFLKKCVLRSFTFLMMSSVSLKAWAATGVLNTYDPNGTASQGDMIGYASSLGSELLQAGGYILFAAAYGTVAYLVVHEFIKLRRGDSDLGKFALVVLVGALVAIFATYFGNLMVSDASNLNSVSQ